MLKGPFLTDLDSRASVKGSRDPLGIQQIWIRLGRHVVGNLTTASSSVRDFTTLLLGYYFAERVEARLGPGSELASFLKWEQLAVYARAEVNKDYSFRGVDRVRKNLAESDRVTLSEGSAYQILGNQKIYGLWGLYSVPSRSSGMLDGDPPRLTPPARRLVEQLYLPILEKGAGKDLRNIGDALEKPLTRLAVRGADAAFIKAVAKVLQRKLSPEERDFYRDHLLHGGPQDDTDGRQRQLAILLEETLSREDFAWSTAMVGSLARSARGRGTDWESLGHHLQRIRASEAVLAPISALFSYVLGLDGKSVQTVAERLAQSWGPASPSMDAAAFAELKGELGPSDAATAERWIAIGDAAAAGQYVKLLRLLVEQNGTVMAARGGAAWIEIRQDRLHVRFRDERGKLPGRADLRGLWRFPYFLDSLRSVAAALQGN